MMCGVGPCGGHLAPRPDRALPGISCDLKPRGPSNCDLVSVGFLCPGSGKLGPCVMGLEIQGGWALLPAPAFFKNVFSNTEGFSFLYRAVALINY